MAYVEATFEIRNDRKETHGETAVFEDRRREITAERELTGPEDAAWAIEAEDYEIIRGLWSDLKETGDFEEWGFRSPYPHGDVDVSLDYEVSIHDVVLHISDRDDVQPESVYLSLATNSRVFDTDSFLSQVKPLVQYLAAVREIGTDDWAHGRPAGGTNMLNHRMPDVWVSDGEE